MHGSRIKNIRRLGSIALTLSRYGFGSVAARMRILPFVGTLQRVFSSKKGMDALSVPQRIRLVLEDLGPTFIKLGQIASTRADLLPPGWIEEFKKLQDKVPPVPFSEIKAVVEGSLGAPLVNNFSSFSEDPVASASIAQVHLATLRSGEEVAVKIKRPGIARIIDSDMSVMHTMAHLLERYVHGARRYRPTEVVDEFERVITKEQDLSIEGANMERFSKIFEGNTAVQIPHVYWNYTTENILTMEAIHGTPIDEVEILRSKGVDIKKVAKKGVELFFKQVFDHGIFHADLHPGNIFVRDDGVIIYLDFGIVGRLDRSLRKYLASILFYIIKKDYRGMARVHREMGLIGESVSLDEFEDTLAEITEPIFGKTLEHIDISGLLMKLLDTARRFDMTLQPNLLLLQKSMVIIEGVGRQLYPDVDMWEVARPLVYRWMIREKFSPKKIIDRGGNLGEDILSSALEAPVKANALLSKTLDNGLKVGFVHHRLEGLVDGIEGAGKKVAGGIVVASLVLAGALMAAFSTSESTFFLGIPLWSGLFFVLALITGVRLFRSPSDG